MHRLTAAVMALVTAACATTMTRPATHTAVVAHERRVRLALDGADRDQVLSCSNACTDFECAASCPTATRAEGACSPDESSARSLCRTFVEPQHEESQPGTCAETASGERRRISCDDHPAEYNAGNAGWVILLSSVVVIGSLMAYGVSHRE